MRDIIQYSVKRILVGILTVFVITVLLFALVRLIPGGPIAQMQGTEGSYTPEQLADLEKQWGLDKPWYEQYVIWISNMVRGDLGKSLLSGMSISRELSDNLPYTLALAGVSMLLTWLLAIPLGILTAYRHNKFIDKLLITLTTVMSSMPAFWLGVLLMVFFSIKLGWTPVGYEGASSFILPVLCNALGFGGLMRITRSEVLNTKSEKYVKTAMAKGLPKRRVTVAHVLRNAIIPITVMAIMGLPRLIGGSVVIETVFSIPGTGTYLVEAINKLDYPIIQVVVFILACLTVVCNLVGDILIAVLDPRARLALKKET